VREPWSEKRADYQRRRRAATKDLSVPRTGREKTARVDLGIALLHRVAVPGVQYTTDEIAAWAGCTNGMITLIERKALKKVRKKLDCRPDLKRDLAEFLERRAA
jgi:hypothetical protein